MKNSNDVNIYIRYNINTIVRIITIFIFYLLV